MDDGSERRSSRRFVMALPLTFRLDGPSGTVERHGETRDVSFRGLYFWAEGDFEPGGQIEFVLTLPKEISNATDVNIRCHGHILRVEPQAARRGVAAQIDRYEFLPASA
jgi:hypothetical protein